MILKWIFDRVVALLGLLFLWPVLVVIAILVRAKMPGGPVIFKQKRVGQHGKLFTMYKFRSMGVQDPKKEAKEWTTKNDVRVTPVGRVIRKTSLDELPQFWNVLKGDMSIVGPRPHMLHHTEIYSELIDKYMVRHFCKPGITGWAQVTGFRGETKELWQMEERVERDIWYIEHWTFMLDIKIIYKTIKSVIIPDKHAY